MKGYDEMEARKELDKEFPGMVKPKIIGSGENVTKITRYRGWHKEEKRMYSTKMLISNDYVIAPDGGFAWFPYGETLVWEPAPWMIPLEYIEIHDVGGSEICGGDFLELNGELLLIVWLSEAWRGPMWGARLIRGDSDYEDGWIFGNVNEAVKNHKIIGNLYENPELERRKL